MTGDSSEVALIEMDENGIHLYPDDDPFTMTYNFDVNDQLWHQVFLTINMSSGQAELYFDAVLQIYDVPIHAAIIDSVD